MRETKFRGQRESDGQWVYGSLIYNGGSRAWIVADGITLDDICLSSHWVRADTVGQVVGLKDKNGVDIYEGDIVKVDDKIMLVQMLEGCWRTKYEEYTNYRLYGWVSGALEVIGNIHQHPELLKP